MKHHPYLASAALALALLMAGPDLHAKNNNGVPQQLDALKAQVASLQAAVAALQGQSATLQTTVGNLQTSNTTLQNQVAALQSTNTNLQNQINGLQASSAAAQNQLANASHLLALDPFVSIDPDPENGVAGPNIIFHGANIYIVSGSGAMDDGGTPRGLGNLIIGYDEDPAQGNLRPPLQAGDRGGSHNLVVGRYNRFTAVGGLVAGEINTISNGWTSVTGGTLNTASGYAASVTGGYGNIARNGPYASVTGGYSNVASGGSASVTGGYYNIATGLRASVTGGLGNTASGGYSVVLGGQNVSNNTELTIAPWPTTAP